MQVAALKWLWGMWVDGKGGILGDDMGLGKTRTMCSFISGLVPETGSASIRRPPAGEHVLIFRGGAEQSISL